MHLLQTGSGLWLVMKSLIFCATDTVFSLTWAAHRIGPASGLWGRSWALRAPPWRARGSAHRGMSSCPAVAAGRIAEPVHFGKGELVMRDRLPGLARPDRKGPPAEGSR